MMQVTCGMAMRPTARLRTLVIYQSWESAVELSYDDALATLREHNTNESLVKHGIAVGAATAAYARRFGEGENRWRIAGLLHDVDYEKHPTIEEHGKVGAH